MKLKCYCDHCPDSTCTPHEGGLCYATISLNNDSQIERQYNCFNQSIRDFPLIRNVVCENTVTSTSRTIMKCCKSDDYCNSPNRTDDDLTQALKEFRLSHGIINGKLTHLRGIYDQYSNLTLGQKVASTSLLVLLLIFIIALAQTYLRRRRRRQHNGAAPNLAEEDGSENSSGKVNSDSAVYDTNSMASREPLISNSCNMSQNANLGYPSGSLEHPHPLRGPYMGDDTCNGKTLSTFQMSLGSGKPQTKPDTSSGSGAGQPYLTQRSIANDIQLIRVIGRGYFGVVWQAEYKGESVAVKIFSTSAEPSWEREAEIYQTTMLRHKNILGFIATDRRHDAAMTGYWLVTDYYPLGSLSYFLSNNSLSMFDTLKMVYSIASGLAHLHVEIFGTQGKPAIAHRDLKSKNILVKTDGTCCIGDLGMAVRYNSSTGIVDVPTNTRVGTRRYLAPELLENKLNLMDFEAVKATDIYSFGLVLWEVLRRTFMVSNIEEGEDSQMEPEEQISSLQSDGSDTLNGRDHAGETREQVEIPMIPSAISRVESRVVINVDEEPLIARPTDEKLSDPLGNDHHYKANFETSQVSFDESTSTSFDVNTDLAVAIDPHVPPYHPYVPLDPTAEEMRDVVCVKKIRPQISLRWTKFGPMRDYVTLMRECWYEKPQSRLSALRIRKSLSDIARHHFNQRIEYD